MENKIYILSETIRSGKTTALYEFCNSVSSVGGILTPDENGMRKIYYPHKKAWYDFQINEENEGIAVGKFNFSNEAFLDARRELSDINFDDFDWIIIDEVGKLELLSASGFEPELSELIRRFKQHSGNTNLLLVIRDSLLQLGIEFYNIQQALVISIADLKSIQISSKSTQDLLGVILCGGQSSRMGFEKFLANYHGVPQYQYLSTLFNNLNIETVISIREEQVSFVDNSLNLVVDNECFFNAGPLTGLLSVHEKYPEKSVLLVGCDYPLLNETHLSMLIENIQDSAFVVCFQNNDGFDEPLIAYYSNSALKEIKAYFNNGNNSLQQFIRSSNAKRLLLDENLFLSSVDTPIEHQFILNHLRTN